MIQRGAPARARRSIAIVRHSLFMDTFRRGDVVYF
jgi:hypothetical protein